MRLQEIDRPRKNTVLMMKQVISGLIGLLSESLILNNQQESARSTNGQSWLTKVSLNFLRDRTEIFGNSFQTWRESVFNSENSKKCIQLTVIKLCKLVSSKLKDRHIMRIILLRMPQLKIRESTVDHWLKEVSLLKKHLILHIDSKNQFWSEDTSWRLRIVIQKMIQKTGLLIAEILLIMYRLLFQL